MKDCDNADGGALYEIKPITIEYFKRLKKEIFDKILEQEKLKQESRQRKH
ncbi:MAG: hypothetical protein LBC92_03975 [Rickettsiales bacterium]|jgi:hypothetical protein|nr:hypothetical protein [Rickettsiales bacterium]